MNKQKRRVSPWAWIPTVYVAEGLPYFAVNTLTVLMYNNLGIPKAEMAFFTGWLYLPWVIKPFWSPFVDLLGTKRSWTVAMEGLIALALAAVALLLPMGFFFVATLIVFWLMAFCSATHDIAADGYYMLELDEREQAAYVGVRSTFYRVASVLGQGGLVMLAGWLEHTTGDIPLSWSLTFFVLSALFLLIFLYHLRILPRPASDRAQRLAAPGEPPACNAGAPDISPKDHPNAGSADIALEGRRSDEGDKGAQARAILRGFWETFVTFFQKPHIWAALCFMLLYRLPEALCIKMTQPFLVDPLTQGGLGLTTAQVGFVNGTVGVIALLAGGIVGGIAIAKGGLRRWLWPMALLLALPCVAYLLLAHWQPSSFLVISAAIGAEQFGYGFGFTAFMLYLMYFSRGESATSHYAFCTAFMALGMMLPGMAAGWLYDLVGGYEPFFWLVMLACIATLSVTAVIHRRLPLSGAIAPGS